MALSNAATEIGAREVESGLLVRIADSALSRYVLLSGQLAAVLWVIKSYNLEGQVFNKLAVLIFLGFTVHYFLPPKARLPFFGLLSATGIVVLLGPPAGVWLLVLGFAVIGICHLPIRFGSRVAVLAAAAAILCTMRVGRLTVPWPAAIWPIFGSMFALRVVIYLYDLRHRRATFSFWRSVGYFFMLPNACFPLFPVVDYETFCRTSDNPKDRIRVYQTGLDWMVRGTVHLVLYRLIYQHLPIDTAAVTDIPQLLRYLFWPFLLYLQVSGLFHLVVGMLHLFGFALPETHHLFYLASSFTDFWRRINIYWKDFMMKVFYYPAYFGLRRFGNRLALVVGTFIVFFATWVLHSWQWFWLRGQVLFKGNDVLFWTILAVLVAGNVLIESNRPMTRRLGSGPVPWRQSVRKGVQALVVFLCICLLWSLWVSDSVVDWVSLFSVLRKADTRDLRLIPVVLFSAVAFVVVALYYERRTLRPFQFHRHALQSGATVIFLAFAGRAAVYKYYPADVADVVAKLKADGLNSRDAARRQRDYYEKLNDIGWDNPELAKLYMVKPADWGSIRYRTDLVKFNKGLPHLELLPNAEGRHRGVQIRFNRWGMRDRDYPLEPQPGTFRIALVGPSHAMGSGVALKDDFESLVEERLNREGRLGSYKRLEILNFSTESYTALDVLASLDEKVLAFKPKALLYTVHAVDAQFGVARLAGLLEERAPIRYPELLQFARRSGVEPGTPERVATRALTGHREALLAWSYRSLVERCRSHGLVPLMAYLPILTPHDYDLPVPKVLAIGRAAGFTAFDLSHVYDGYSPEKLQIAIWDDHPNALGHRLIAESLYASIRGIEGSLWRADELGSDQRAGAGLHPTGVSPGGGP